jgi:hypothetical protein
MRVDVDDNVNDDDRVDGDEQHAVTRDKQLPFRVDLLISGTRAKVGS